MNLALLSLFRNATPYIGRFFIQVDKLRQTLRHEGNHTLQLVLVEGDSKDATWPALREMAPKGSNLSQCHHGGPHYGPIVHPQRFRQLARVGNHLFDRIPDNADAVLFVESDLIWDAYTMLKLLRHLTWASCAVPMVMDGPQSFYDTWAYRRNGKQFVKQPPYHPDLGTELIELDSAGSCMALWAELARNVRFTEKEVFVGLCKQIRATGAKIWLDPTLTVTHP